MVIRPVDENGDMVPVSSLEQMLMNENAIGQVINLRLNFYYGEWWEDEESGFQIPDLLIRGMRHGDVNMLSEYIATYISETDGVSEVLDVIVSYSDHKMTFSCVVLLDDGETEMVEVNLDGVL